MGCFVPPSLWYLRLHRGGPCAGAGPIPRNRGPSEKRRSGQRDRQREDRMRTQREDRCPQARQGTRPAHIVISDFQPPGQSPGLWDSRCLWFKPPAAWSLSHSGLAEYTGQITRCEQSGPACLGVQKGPGVGASGGASTPHCPPLLPAWACVPPAVVFFLLPWKQLHPWTGAHKVQKAEAPHWQI